VELATIDNTKEWTVEDYLGLGEESWYQLINGSLIMSPSPSLKHQLIIGEIYKLLDAFAKATNSLAVLSPIDIYLDEKNVFQPDVLLVSEARKKILSNKGLEGAPDLVVEVLSVSNSKYDRYEKREIYHKFGVLEYWIIDPATNSVEVFDLKNEPNKPLIYLAQTGSFNSIYFEGLEVDLEGVFRES